MERALEHDIAVVGLEFTDDAAIFRVRGVGDEYDVTINQSVDLFCPD